MLSVFASPVSAFADDEGESDTALVLSIDEQNIIYTLDSDGERFTGTQDFSFNSQVYSFVDGVLVSVDGNGLYSLEINDACYLVSQGKLYDGFYGKIYYTSGVRNYSINGFYMLNGAEYYLESGLLFSGLHNSYLYNDGVKDTVYKGLITIGGTEYYLSNGKLATAVVKMSSGKNKDKFVYFKDGVFNKKSGKTNVNKSTYYLSNGIAKGGLKTIGDKKYYFNKKTCKLIKSREIKLGDKWYIANKDGVLRDKPKAYIKAAEMINRYTLGTDSDYEKLHKCYKWTASHCSYAYKKNYYKPSGKKWVNKYASNMFQTRRGRCYSFAAAFAVMAREIGYKDVKVVVGSCNGFTGRYIPHAWVEVVIDGKRKVFDPEYEYRHVSRDYRRSFDQTYATMRSGYKISYTVKVKK